MHHDFTDDRYLWVIIASSHGITLCRYLINAASANIAITYDSEFLLIEVSIVVHVAKVPDLTEDLYGQLRIEQHLNNHKQRLLNYSFVNILY